MPRSILSVEQVAASLHVSVSEVIRLAEDGILPGSRVRGQWQFRAGEVWNWIEANLHGLPARREKDRHPEWPADSLIEPVLRPIAIAVDVAAKTRSSILRELVKLAEPTDPTIDTAALIDALSERERTGSTALERGVAVPHPARPLHSEGPILAAARTVHGLPFGERGGGLTDLFFLVCCPSQANHLLFLGRLCRLLIDRSLLYRLRAAADADEFCDALIGAERALCARMETDGGGRARR